MKFFKAIASCLLTAACPFQAAAVTLDWNSVDWTAGSLTQSFDIDGSNAGNDITITISSDTGGLNSGYPDDTTEVHGGFSGQEALTLRTNHANDSDFLTITIAFNYTNGVQGVGFTLTDIDENTPTWTDLVWQFRGIRSGSEVSQASLTGGSSNTIGSSGGYNYALGTSSASGTTSAGNVGVDYGSTVVDTVSFRWYNYTDNGDQVIGMTDITFTPAVPDPVVVMGGGLLGLLAGWHALRRRRTSL